MYYKSIELKNYRSYKERAFDFHEKVNVLIGENARGKTNLLEGIYLTSYGKSFRTYNDKELVKFGEEDCRVKGVFRRDITGDDDNEIEIFISKEGKRRGRVNGREFTKFSDIFDNVLAVIFSPEDLKIIKESPDKRRSFINDELSQLSLLYYKNLINYRRVLKQRNTYLKEENRSKEMLQIWDENLIEYGSQIILQRYFFIKKLNKICKEIYRKLSGGKEEISVGYDSNILKKEEKEEIFGEKYSFSGSEKNEALQKIRNTFAEKIKETRESDLLNRYTGKGPQKDDIEVLINKINARNFGSQGQQRTAALSLKLSEIELVKEEKGEYPILLLDDVLSELDQSRQKFLLNSLHEVQLFITATDLPKDVENSLPAGKIIEI